MLFVINFFIIIAVFFFIYVVKICFFIKNKKKFLGISEGIILYSDLNTHATPLFSKYSRLIGKPDYIVRKKNHSIPVEVKFGKALHPNKSHIMQLAAYCQILEDISGIFVPEGILVYNNVEYIIPFDPKMRFKLELQMKTMRALLRNGFVKKNHKDLARCRYCSMKYCCINTIFENHFS